MLYPKIGFKAQNHIKISFSAVKSTSIEKPHVYSDFNTRESTYFAEVFYSMEEILTFTPGPAQ